MKWLLVVLVTYNGKPSLDHIDGFKTREACLVASNELRDSLKKQEYTGWLRVFTHCTKVDTPNAKL